jgi:hypothetical protein
VSEGTLVCNINLRSKQCFAHILNLIEDLFNGCHGVCVVILVGLGLLTDNYSESRLIGRIRSLLLCATQSPSLMC